MFNFVGRKLAFRMMIIATLTFEPLFRSFRVFCSKLAEKKTNEVGTGEFQLCTFSDSPTCFKVNFLSNYNHHHHHHHHPSPPYIEVQIYEENVFT